MLLILSLNIIFFFLWLLLLARSILSGGLVHVVLDNLASLLLRNRERRRTILQLQKDAASARLLDVVDIVAHVSHPVGHAHFQVFSDLYVLGDA